MSPQIEKDRPILSQALKAIYSNSIVHAALLSSSLLVTSCVESNPQNPDDAKSEGSSLKMLSYAERIRNKAKLANDDAAYFTVLNPSDPNHVPKTICVHTDHDVCAVKIYNSFGKAELSLIFVGQICKTSVDEAGRSKWHRNFQDCRDLLSKILGDNYDWKPRKGFEPVNTIDYSRVDATYFTN